MIDSINQPVAIPMLLVAMCILVMVMVAQNGIDVFIYIGELLLLHFVVLY